MKTVLVLEDEPVVMSFIRHVLTEYRLLESTTAEEAILHFRQHDGDVDLLVADVALPISSGIRVALELRSLNPALKIILTSGYPLDMWPDQDAAEFNEIPSDSVAKLQKPFGPATLLTLVQRLTTPLSKGVGAGESRVGD